MKDITFCSNHVCDLDCKRKVKYAPSDFTWFSYFNHENKDYCEFYLPTNQITCK